MRVRGGPFWGQGSVTRVTGPAEMTACMSALLSCFRHRLAGCFWSLSALVTWLMPQPRAPAARRRPRSSVKLDDADDVDELRDWLASAFDYMAMGK